MAVQVIVENGTGLVEATSYINVDEMETLWDQMGYSYGEDLNIDAKMQLVNRSTLYLDGYKSNWSGAPVNPQQALVFPRAGMTDKHGYPVEGIPRDIKKAQACMAYWLHAKGYETIAPLASASGDIKEQENEVGPIREKVVYFEGTAPTNEFVKVPEVEVYLKRYTRGAGGCINMSSLGGFSLPRTNLRY